MQIRVSAATQNARRTRLAIILHWLVAFLSIFLIILGAWMTELSYYHPRYHDSLAAHRALGIIAFAAALCMLTQKIFARRLSPIAELKPWEAFAAKGAHIMLFILMFVVPITGYIISTSAGDGVSVFGLFTTPALFKVNEEARDTAVLLHYWLAYGVGVLVFIHAGAALKHHFWDKNDVLKRMLRG